MGTGTTEIGWGQVRHNQRHPQPVLRQSGSVNRCRTMTGAGQVGVMLIAVLAHPSHDHHRTPPPPIGTTSAHPFHQSSVTTRPTTMPTARPARKAVISRP
jgi:hypothetical protein